MPKKVKSKKYPSGYGYQIDVRLKNQPRERHTFPTKELAQQAEIKLKSNALKKDFGLAVESTVTMKQLVDRHIAEIKDRRPKIKRVETILNRFITVTGEKCKVENIKTSHLNDYAQLRLKTKIQPQSINREFHEITSCLNSSCKYFASLEDYKSPRPPYQEEPDLTGGRLWTDEEIDAVVAKLMEPPRPHEQGWKVKTRHDVADMFLVALNTGLRAGEVVKIKKADVDFANEVLYVMSQKGKRGLTRGRKREVPLNDDAAIILRKRMESATSDFLFPGRNGQAPLSNPQKAFATACKDAGIEYGVGKLLFKHTRRTYENRLLDQGYRIDLVCEILGHSEQTMLKHYSQVTREQKLRAVKTLKVGGQILDNKAPNVPNTPHSPHQEKQQKAQ